MAIVNPLVTVRWQAMNSSFGMVSGELNTRVKHGYRRELVLNIKNAIRDEHPNRLGNLWTISMVNEEGETIYREEHTV